MAMLSAIQDLLKDVSFHNRVFLENLMALETVKIFSDYASSEFLVLFKNAKY
jgi:hypothetical protein